MHVIDITAQDFRGNIEDVIYHLDFPVAGPGSFPQFMVSALAVRHLKVVLGGQGGDEIFGGYARYLVAYFEQSIKAAMDGTYRNGNYVVTIESIVPNLGLLREYKPIDQGVLARRPVRRPRQAVLSAWSIARPTWSARSIGRRSTRAACSKASARSSTTRTTCEKKRISTR